MKHPLQNPGLDIYTDQGISGTTSNRPGFADMMNHARARDFQILLVKSISRLARNTVDLLSCVRELATLGVAVRFEREKIDTSSAEGELMLTLLASFAQEESRSLSQNVKWAIRNRYNLPPHLRLHLGRREPAHQR